eukprot:scaffold12020_cov122-Isochrysis_galbana.AAC.6
MPPARRAWATGTCVKARGWGGEEGVEVRRGGRRGSRCGGEGGGGGGTPKRRTREGKRGSCWGGVTPHPWSWREACLRNVTNSSRPSRTIRRRDRACAYGALPVWNLSSGPSFQDVLPPHISHPPRSAVHFVLIFLVLKTET